MTDIVVGVRLNADGSGLVGQLKLSKAEMQQLRAAEKDAADAARDLNAATEQASAAIGKNTGEARKSADAKKAAAQAAREESRALDDFRKMLDPAAIEQAKLNRQLELSELLHRKGLLSAEQYAEVQRRLSADTSNLTKNVGLARAGWQQVGFQVQDVFASYASGSRLSVIFAQQSGQLASAIALIAQSAEGTGGKMAGLAAFLGGPWGIAIGIAVSVGSALVSTLLQASDATDKVKLSSSSLSDSQTILGSVMDITTGKMKVQTEAALGLAFAQAQLNRVNAQKAAAQFRGEVAGQREASYRLEAGMMGGLSIRDTVPGAQKAIAQGVLDRLADPTGKAGISTADAVQRLDNLRKAGALTDEAYAKAAASVANLGVELENIKISDATIRMLQGDGTSADRRLLLKPEKTKKDNSAAQAAREAERLASFSERAAEAVARLNDEYNTAPRDIDRARQSTAQLDAIIRDVNKRLESGKKLTDAQREELNRVKASAEALKPAIHDSLVRPITDMLEGQQRQIDLGKLQVSGRQAEAQALQLTWTLMDKLGAESEDQLATELAKRGVTADQVKQLYGNLGVLREQTREMQKQQVIQDAFLGAIHDQRENVRLTLESLRKDGPKAFGDFFKRSLDVVDRLFSEVATEKLFGGLFRDLEDQVTGADKVSKAGDKIANAVERAAADITTLGNAAAHATAILSGEAASGGGAFAGAKGIVAGDQPAPDLGDFGDIIVNGRRPKLRNIGGFREGYEELFGGLKRELKDVFNDIFGDRGVFNGSLGKTLGKLTAGAQIGASSGALVTGLLGIKGSQTLGMAGGAIGSAIAGPLGSVVGGVLGSVVGGMLKKTPRASATITGGGENDVSVTGNNSKLREASLGLAGSVQDTLKQIAEEFGGDVGQFGVSIGLRHGDYRVDTSGRGITKKKKGAIDFDDDQAGAIAYAVMDAITDGGITGVSAAVQKALTRSKDLDKAIAEALKVKEVETLLGGLGAELANQFKDFEKQAKERVRIATEYGFDVVAIEKKNAEDRAKLVDQILTDRVGSLQQLLADMKFGDLFEGSLADQRQALLAEIAATKTAAEAGESGAADKLAALSRQLVELSRDAYGTAGAEYSSDRASSISAAEQVIKLENDRIKAAQEAATQSNVTQQALLTQSQTQTDLLSQMLKEFQLFGKTITIPNTALLAANVGRSA